MTTTYGTLRWEPGSKAGTWVINTTPHVSMRLKRIFPRVMQAATADIWIRDTPEVARDLEWVLTRHPLEVDEASMARLVDRARQHRDTEQTCARIVAGDLTLDLKEPARPPRPYQVQAADLCHVTGRLLLGDDVGLGKTFSSLLLLRDPDTLPALVVTLTHLPKQWQRELDKSLPWLTSHIATKGTAYDVETDVLIMNYAKLSGWADHLAGQVRTVIFDEVQELRRSESMKWQAARRIADAASWRMGLSATPVYNDGGEVHTIYQVLAPDALGTRTEFIREWGGTEYGTNRIRLGNPGALGTWLRDEGLFLRRTRKDVHRELPDPIRIVHDVETDTAALDAIEGDIRALAHLVRDSDNKTQRWQAAGEIDWKMRQATGIDKARYVAEFVRLLLESEEKVVLFGWHRAVYDMWLDKLADFRPVLYTGSESPTQKQAAADAFVDGDARVLIMSLRSGAGLDGLQERASALVFGELDWSPAMHDQCIGRLARDGQENTVVAYFLVSDHGTDPLMAEVLELKRQQAEPIRDPDTPLVDFNAADAGRDRIALLVDSVLQKDPS